MYDAGRATGDWVAVRAAERIDERPAVVVGARVALPAVVPHLPAREDAQLRGRLERLGRAFDGWCALFVQDLVTGRYAGWNADARFPAASTVKLGVLAEGIRRFGYGPRSPIDYDLRQLGSWSSNLAANRIYELVGGGSPVGAALTRLGMWSSTYPGAYRIGTGVGDVVDPPPLATARVTTARDLARGLFRLQAAAAGQRWAVRETALTSAGARAALGYLGLAWRGRSLLALPRGVRAAEKDGWTKDVRASAAVVYPKRGARIVVVLTYRPSLDPRAARALGRRVSRLVFG
jgi:beta-lactamase class A